MNNFHDSVPLLRKQRWWSKGDSGAMWSPSRLALERWTPCLMSTSGTVHVRPHPCVMGNNKNNNIQQSGLRQQVEKG